MLSASAPPVDGRNPDRSTSDVMMLSASRAVRERCSAKTWACSTVTILLGRALDLRDVELAALAARALGDGHLVLVDERVAGVEYAYVRGAWGIRPITSP